MAIKLSKSIELPESVTCVLEDSNIRVKGKLGEIQRDFAHSNLVIEKDNTSIVLTVYYPRKTNKAVLGTVASHVQNMVDGVQKGFKYSLKIVYSHFPIKISENRKNMHVKIENLYGGRKSLFAKIIGKDTKVEVAGEDVYVTGINKENVGQTSANIQEITRLRGKKRKSTKTFMDGIFITDRKGQIE